MLEYIKINADMHEVHNEGKIIGYIICDRSSTSIRGYKVVIKGEVLGYGFGDYKRNLKAAKVACERNYVKFRDFINKPSVYYDAELDMYFSDKGLYERFKTTPVYANRVLKMKSK